MGAAPLPPRWGITRGPQWAGCWQGPLGLRVRLQALPSADARGARQGRPATTRNSGGGAGPEILGPQR